MLKNGLNFPNLIHKETVDSIAAFRLIDIHEIKNAFLGYAPSGCFAYYAFIMRIHNKHKVDMRNFSNSNKRLDFIYCKSFFNERNVKMLPIEGNKNRVSYSSKEKVKIVEYFSFAFFAKNKNSGRSKAANAGYTAAGSI